MRRFFEPSRPLVTPRELVKAITGRRDDELHLPERAIILFDTGDLRRLLKRVPTLQAAAWSAFRPVYHVEKSGTILTRSYFGGPNIAACMEELSAFGVREFVALGYCGAVDPALTIGDTLAALAALREDGVSHHYLGHGRALVGTQWLEDWRPRLLEHSFREAVIWSCDAIYRETAEKVARYAKKGISAVEMETASLYAVAEYHALKALSLLVVSDELHGGTWRTGFHSPQLRKGIERLIDFVVEKVIA